MGYYGQKPRFWLFLAKMAIFGHFSEKSPGSYRAKKPENGQKRPFSSKPPKSPGPGQGFYINPSRPRPGTVRGPRGPGTGSGTPRGPLGQGIRDPGSGTSGTWVPGDPSGPGPGACPGPPRPLGPPPRGPGARVLHQPLAPGPRGSRGGVPGRGPRESPPGARG